MNKAVGSDGTVGKAMDILDSVAAVGRPVRFSELLESSPHPKATLYRFLQTLTNQGMLAYDADRHTYSLGLKLVRLAHSAWRQSTLAPIARPFLDRLAEKVGETVHLAQIDNGHVIFVDKCRATNLFETLAQPGRVAPAFCTGVGKIILAHMSPKRQARALSQQAFLQYTPNTHTSLESLQAELGEIAQAGIAFDREEHEQGIISIAAPILNEKSRVIGAVSIATTTTRHTPEGLMAFREDLIETVKHVGEAAESWQFPDQS